MTPEDLIAWRENLGWSQGRVAKELDLALRTYQYLETHHTSSGRQRDRVPRVIELAIQALTRQNKQKKKSHSLL